ncbi:MAG: L,D-transpeptidase [Gammaproteobacteria bacterium]
MMIIANGPNSLYVTVSIPEQTLRLLRGGECLRTFRVSTARNGPGEARGSECTPRGLHTVRAKIGAGLPADTVFVGRRPTGERYTPELKARFPGRDWILTRILWLSGAEVGCNRLGEVDSMRRYIYIHGCPDDVPVGVPRSHGCIRMRNVDVMELFDRVDVGSCVRIIDDADAIKKP